MVLEPTRGNSPKPTRSSWRRPSTIFASTTRTSPSSTSGRPTRSPTSTGSAPSTRQPRSEEHTSELQSRGHLVCRLLLEKKNAVYHRINKLYHIVSIKLPKQN